MGIYTGLTIDVCLKFKELSKFLSKYLGIDVCLGAEFKQYPIQQMAANGVFVQVLFLKVCGSLQLLYSVDTRLLTHDY